MSSFASGSNLSSKPPLTTLDLSNDKVAPKTHDPDDSESRQSLKSLSSAASGLRARFMRPRSGADSSRTKHNSGGDKERERVYRLIPIAQLVSESPWTEYSPTKPITVTLRYAIAEGKPEQIRLTITCEITKSDGKYVQFTNPYFDTLDNLKVSIPTAIWAELLNRLQDDHKVYSVAKTFLDELFKRMF
jgi:hypothetical protein